MFYRISMCCIACTSEKERLAHASHSLSDSRVALISKTRHLHWSDGMRLCSPNTYATHGRRQHSPLTLAQQQDTRQQQTEQQLPPHQHQHRRRHMFMSRVISAGVCRTNSVGPRNPHAVRGAFHSCVCLSRMHSPAFVLIK